MFKARSTFTLWATLKSLMMKLSPESSKENCEDKRPK